MAGISNKLLLLLVTLPHRFEDDPGKNTHKEKDNAKAGHRHSCTDQQCIFISRETLLTIYKYIQNGVRLFYHTVTVNINKACVTTAFFHGFHVNFGRVLLYR